ncbi:hypothetical protein DYY67_1198 [Candidatus Nitrosotalea sp. TS]|uniref:hypothetical protein n=1 Tax=Candidatus Nitrosotalea sp. TS TaxID=2341020 RepID=UPI0014099310|nr:hypothetical protein [Candidatus Nitrosotalea sp. TS]NHI04340.1 hypothetical protein [Candidatus Nitrosotalea sp. TS]
MMNENNLIEKVAPGLLFAQGLDPRPVYRIKQHGVKTAGSEKTAYRRIQSLVQFGLATFHRGQFSIKKEVVSQPLDVIEKMLPSLLALKQARRFGRSYNRADINFALAHKLESSLVTLDFQTWSLTKFQFPNDLYVYVDDVESNAKLLKDSGFSEGDRGHVVLLPKIGSFENEIERIYLDCIANGGRSVLDAVALQLLYPEQIAVKGRFPVEVVAKVQGDMPSERSQEVAPAYT